MDTRRDQIINIIEREFIGPDPIDVPGLVQENGEEILSSDPPRVRYIAGVLFPQKVKQDENTQENEPEAIEPDDTDETDVSPDKGSGSGEVLQDAEELLNLSNAYQQSAISLTAAVLPGTTVSVFVSAGTYITLKEIDPETEKERTRYPRASISWNNDGLPVELPIQGTKKYNVTNNGRPTDLCFAITYRYTKSGCNLYTFTLENTNVAENGKIRDEDCYFQVQFDLMSGRGFSPIPETEKLTNDNDYLKAKL